MSSEQDQRDREQSPAKIAADLIELAVEYGADDEDLQPIIEKAIAKLVADTREECAQIADDDVAYQLDHDHGPCMHDCRDAPERIAQAIRGGEPDAR